MDQKKNLEMGSVSLPKVHAVSSASSSECYAIVSVLYAELLTDLLVYETRIKRNIVIEIII